MASKQQVKKKPDAKAKPVAKPAAPAKAVAPAKPAPAGKTPPAAPAKAPLSGKDVSRIAASIQQQAESQIRRQIVLTPEQEARRDSLHRMLMAKRQEVLKEIGGSLGQSVTEDQKQRIESAKDIGDQALMDLEREVDISLMEMRNKKRQMIDEAMTRLSEGTYGICAECGVDISEKRLAVVPFAKLCVECQARTELLEKIEKEEDRD